MVATLIDDTRHAVVVSGMWPGTTSGHAIANTASLALYCDRFRRITYFGPRDFDSSEATREFPEVRFHAVNFDRLSRATRFCQSLVSRYPAITVRYWAGTKEIIRSINSSEDMAPQVFVYEDTPPAFALLQLKPRFPQATHVVRSHNMVYQGFTTFSTSRSSNWSFLPWQIELSKIKTFEQSVAAQADEFYAITTADAGYYDRLSGIRCDGVLGVHLPAKFVDIPIVVNKTVVMIGSADLRKGAALYDFVTKTWPNILARHPDAKLLLAGRDTESFSNPALRITGLGFVESDVEVLREGAITINPQVDGAGLKLKSAVALLSGKALVSSPVGIEGIPAEPDNDYLLAKQPTDFADCICRLLDDPDLLLKIATNARHFARSFFARDNILRVSSPRITNSILSSG